MWGAGNGPGLTGLRNYANQTELSLVFGPVSHGTVTGNIFQAFYIGLKRGGYRSCKHNYCWCDLVSHFRDECHEHRHIMGDASVRECSGLSITSSNFPSASVARPTTATLVACRAPGHIWAFPKTRAATQEMDPKFMETVTRLMGFATSPDSLYKLRLLSCTSP